MVAGSEHSKFVSMTSTDGDVDVDIDTRLCLFCNQTSLDLDLNVTHMCKAHGLYIDSTSLSVDLQSFLRYIHLLIFRHHECLYCGSVKNSCEAVQQHMLSKGHCKYDLTDRDSELRDFFDASSHSSEDESRRLNLVPRAGNNSQTPMRAILRQQRRSKKSRDGYDQSVPMAELPSASPFSMPDNSRQSGHDNNVTSPAAVQLSANALKQEHTLQLQLATLSKNDQRSLAHLPPSQQRAILASQHQQRDKAQRTETLHQGRLETAGNVFGRLGTVRLVRTPPHFGNVSGLNR